MNNKKWGQLYNLADIVRFNFAKGLDFNKDTIAYQYVDQMDGPLSLTPHDTQAETYKIPSVDFELLYEIVSKREATPLSTDTFAVHVRVGDCLTLYPDRIPRSKTFIDIIQKYNLHRRFSKCVIVSGNHNSAALLASKKYILKLKTEIENLNVSCNLVSGDADEDFTILSTAKCYIAGYRGFGWLSASINPNEVIWDIQKPPEFPWLMNRAWINQLIEGYEFRK